MQPICWLTFYFIFTFLFECFSSNRLTNAAANELQNLHLILATFSLGSHDPEVRECEVTSTKPAYPFGFEHKPDMSFLVTTWNSFWNPLGIYSSNLHGSADAPTNSDLAGLKIYHLQSQILFSKQLIHANKYTSITLDVLVRVWAGLSKNTE